MLVAVAEIVVGHTKGSTPKRANHIDHNASLLATIFPLQTTALGAYLLMGLSLQPVYAQTLPSHGNVVGGAASIAQSNPNKLLPNLPIKQ